MRLNTVQLLTILQLKCTVIFFLCIKQKYIEAKILTEYVNMTMQIESLSIF